MDAVASKWTLAQAEMARAKPIHARTEDDFRAIQAAQIVELAMLNRADDLARVVPIAKAKPASELIYDESGFVTGAAGLKR